MEDATLLCCRFPLFRPPITHDPSPCRLRRGSPRGLAIFGQEHPPGLLFLHPSFFFASLRRQGAVSLSHFLLSFYSLPRQQWGLTIPSASTSLLSTPFLCRCGRAWRRPRPWRGILFTGGWVCSRWGLWLRLPGAVRTTANAFAASFSTQYYSCNTVLLENEQIIKAAHMCILLCYYAKSYPC